MIGVYGANSLVGHEILNALAEKGFDAKDIAALGGQKDQGKPVSFGDTDLMIENIADVTLGGNDVIFYAPDMLADKKEISELAKKAGKIIDCTGETALEPARPANIIALPSARAQLLISALEPLYDAVDINRIVVTILEATSGAGKDGMDELFNQSRKFFVADGLETHVFGKQMAFNILPQVERFLDSGATEAEDILEKEIKRFVDKDIETAVTCVQVPVFIGFSAAVTVEFDDALLLQQAMELWQADEGVTIIERKSEMQYVTPAEIAGEDTVFISRIRKDNSVEHGLSFWCTADNIRALTALRAVSVAGLS